MPVEIVYGKQYPYGSLEDPGLGRSIVEVRWDRETGYFQIVTRCVRADTHETFIPEHVLEKLLIEGDEEIPFLLAQEGFWVDLDRAGINNLIRNLRRARDQAFGRDE